MHNTVKITDKVYWIGANDRRTHLFENMWPLPYGISYNSYLIVDDKIALVDTLEQGSSDDYLVKIEELIGKERSIDYLIINHMEPDHSGAMKAIVERYPDIKIVGNLKTFKIIEFYYGYKEKWHQVEDGSQIDLGYHKLKFVMTPWVHWPETMMTYDETEKMLFSGDAFGSFGSLDGGIFDDEIEFEDYYEEEMRRYYSNIVGQYSNMVQKAYKKLDGVDIKYICSTHGPVWRSDVNKVISLYDRWSKYESEKGVVIIYGSMYGNTAKLADFIARKLAENGIKKIRVYDASKTHLSYLINEIWRYKGVVLGSCAYNSGMLPTMEQLTRTLEHMGVKNHLLGIFGSYSWNGGGVKSLHKFYEKIQWDLVSDPVDTKGIPGNEEFDRCETIAREMAEKLKDN
ncbi:MAG TPA: FprA family A-type flavoprotein [Bacteroidales bacterium]|nr:FprA family A-type flavoprotein [Bacteroidales bacterium]